MRPHGWIGLGLLIAAEVLLFTGNPFVGEWMTPVAWTAYILFVDGLVYRLKGESLLTTRRRELWPMLPLSIISWLVFEFYNQLLQNWYYIDLSENLYQRGIGYAWAFATIFPALFETADLFQALKIFKKCKGCALSFTPTRLRLSLTLGLVFLGYPLLFPSPYLFAPVWVGVILFLEPMNRAYAPQSLFRDVEGGDYERFLSLLAAGLLCGFLWEFWNFWATAKWMYTVPILPRLKIFEMPVIGYLGFPPFALECFAMYQAGRALFRF